MAKRQLINTGNPSLKACGVAPDRTGNTWSEGTGFIRCCDVSAHGPKRYYGLITIEVSHCHRSRFATCVRIPIRPGISPKHSRASSRRWSIDSKTGSPGSVTKPTPCPTRVKLSWISGTRSNLQRPAPSATPLPRCQTLGGDHATHPAAADRVTAVRRVVRPVVGHGPTEPTTADFHSAQERFELLRLVGLTGREHGGGDNAFAAGRHAQFAAESVAGTAPCVALRFLGRGKDGRRKPRPRRECWCHQRRAPTSRSPLLRRPASVKPGPSDRTRPVSAGGSSSDRPSGTARNGRVADAADPLCKS